MPVKDDPARLLYPGFTGRVMVDTWRGVVRVRKWPDKRGRPKSAAVRAQNDWFRDANRLASRAPGTQVATAIEITKGSGLYPRDILIRMIAGNLGTILLPDGDTLTKATKRIEPVSFQGAILNLIAPLSVGAGNTAPITWGLPVFDPLGLWSPGAPTRLTVPANVTIIRVMAGIVYSTGGTSRARHFLKQNGVLVNQMASGLWNTVGVNVDSGPLSVVPGDYFEVVPNPSATRTAQAGQVTYFSLEFLTAV